MACPNGHKGTVFCCEDHVNQHFAEFYERYKNYHRGGPLIPVTLGQWEAYRELLKEDKRETTVPQLQKSEDDK